LETGADHMTLFCCLVGLFIVTSFQLAHATDITNQVLIDRPYGFTCTGILFRRKRKSILLRHRDRTTNALHSQSTWRDGIKLFALPHYHVSQDTKIMQTLQRL